MVWMTHLEAECLTVVRVGTGQHRLGVPPCVVWQQVHLIVWSIVRHHSDYNSSGGGHCSWRWVSLSPHHIQKPLPARVCLRRWPGPSPPPRWPAGRSSCCNAPAGGQMVVINYVSRGGQKIIQDYSNQRKNYIISEQPLITDWLSTNTCTLSSPTIAADWPSNVGLMQNVNVNVSNELSLCDSTGMSVGEVKVSCDNRAALILWISVD